MHTAALSVPMTTTTWDIMHLLAGVAFPPHACNSYVRLRFHGLFGRYAGCVQHCLQAKVSSSCSAMAEFRLMANLSTWEIVSGSQGRRVFVECRLAVSHRIFCEMWKAEEARLLWLLLLFEVARIHCGRRAGVRQWLWECLGKIFKSRSNSESISK
jgi:hypothetical protein